MRLFTRPDLDGIVSAAMITDMEEISEVIYVHPRDMQNGSVEVEEGDAISNLPFHPNAALWFDHHLYTDVDELHMPEGVKGKIGKAPSAARQVYEYYASEDLKKYADMLEDVDRFDSAELGYGDILNPQGWVLLGFTIDSRTGLGASEDYCNELIILIRAGGRVDEILAHPLVCERVERYKLEEDQFKIAMIAHTKLKKNICINDFRDMDTIPAGNRFLVYAVFPHHNINIRISKIPGNDLKVLVAVAKSIFYRNHPVNIGELMAKYGGGGMGGAGSCTFYNNEADDKIEELIKALKM